MRRNVAAYEASDRRVKIGEFPCHMMAEDALALDDAALLVHARTWLAASGRVDPKTALGLHLVVEEGG